MLIRDAETVLANITSARTAGKNAASDTDAIRNQSETRSQERPLGHLASNVLESATASAFLSRAV
jgi:hypothetical protein